MPTRILRDGILTSERVALLGWGEEVFYRRLMSVVDDHGRFHAHPSLLRAACYPLMLDKVSDSDVVKWLAMCANAGLVRVYTGVVNADDRKGSPRCGEPAGVSGHTPKKYLEVVDFGQRVQSKSKYPDPPSVEPAAVPLRLVANSDVRESTVNHGETRLFTGEQRDSRALPATDSRINELSDGCEESTVFHGEPPCFTVNNRLVGVVVEQEQEQDQKLSPSLRSVDSCRAESDATADDEPDDDFPEGRRKRATLTCPITRIADLWDECIPEKPSVTLWTRDRRGAISARWRQMAAHYGWKEQAEGLDWFGRLFRKIRESEFLMGRVRPRNKDDKPFALDMDWAFGPKNFTKIVEGKYHEQR